MNIDLEKKFLDIPKDMSSGSYKAATMHHNIHKNNFSNIMPPDDHRVVLSDDNSNDYINASHVFGKYIATQEPLGRNVNDFWHMIYVFSVGMIINLTHLVNYIPVNDSGSQIFGDYCVVLKSVDVYQKIRCYELEIYKVCNMDNIKKIILMNFSDWPDHGVPCDDSKDLFREFVKKTLNCNDKMVVHCRAGVGRTGTFILIHKIISDIINTQKLEKPINDLLVDNCKELRKYRPGSIQSFEQFKFAYDIIIENPVVKFYLNNNIKINLKRSYDELSSTNYKKISKKNGNKSVINILNKSTDGTGNKLSKSSNMIYND